MRLILIILSLTCIFPVQPLFLYPVVAQTTYDLQVKANGLLEEGLKAYKNNKLPRAIELLQRALTIYESTDDRLHTASTLGYLGNVYQSLGEYKRAYEHHQRQLNLVRSQMQQLKNKPRNSNSSSWRQINTVLQIEADQAQIKALNNLGHDYWHLGDRVRAKSCYEEAEELSQKIDDYQGLALSIHGIGNIYSAEGKNKQAISAYQKAINFFAIAGDKIGESLALYDLGSIVDPDWQILLYKQSLNLVSTLPESQQLSPQHLSMTSEVDRVSKYRRLADLLLQRERVFEAQQVLDSSKSIPLQAYGAKIKAIDLDEREQSLWSQYQDLVDESIKITKQVRSVKNEIASEEQERLIREQQRVNEAIMTLITFTGNNS
ncbi:MAG: hypothetical protein N5P05_002435 [Chroococcopsis gigantea SAG 12.99]|jgi:tetratricopeptide (TPR) repeat protein|nr:hypothetical protein [Chroococcopsis gigantea SAG 12.99]